MTAITTFIFSHDFFMGFIITLLFLSILCQILTGVLYGRLISQTENMSSTSNKSLLQLKRKFYGCCKIGDGISNIPVFVDKYMRKLKIGAVPLTVLRHISGQLMMFAILMAGIAACLGIIADKSFFQIAPFYISCFIGLYGYFSVSSLVDIPGKANILKTNLVDYLENHFLNQIEQTSVDMQFLKQKMENNISPTEIKADTQKENSPMFSKTEIEELELLLESLLTQ